MMGGGVVKGSTTTLIGPSGVGKTLLSLKFLEAGLERGERCVYFGFYESPERLVAKAEAVSIRLEAAVKDGRLTIQWQPAVELAIDELAAELIAVVKRTNASRLVVDGIEGFHDSANRVERFGLFLNALTHRLRQFGVTTMLTEELPLYTDTVAHRRDARLGDDREYRAPALRRGEFRALPDARRSSSSARTRTIRRSAASSSTSAGCT